MENVNNEYTIAERLTDQQLIELLQKWNNAHAGKTAVHIESKGFYKVDHFCVLNRNGMAELAVTYHPIDNGTKYNFTSIKHTRPCSEFFDGRFII